MRGFHPLGLGLGLNFRGMKLNAASGFTGLLDTYPGAAAAYSLRVLGSSFASADLILARRSSDNAELGFTATEIIDGTLTTWAGAGDAFVKTWYDQSGSGRDATQATAARQAKIVESGSLVVGGLKFDGADDEYTMTSVAAEWIAAVCKDVANAQSIHQLVGSGSDANIRTSSTAWFVQNPLSFGYQDAIKVNGSSSPLGATSEHLVTSSRGNSVMTTAARISSSFSSRYWSGTINEIIIWSADQTSNRAGIESNIADYYGFTLP